MKQRKVTIAEWGNWYSPEKSDTAELSILAFFLTGDFGRYDEQKMKRLENWIFSPGSDWMVINKTTLEKVGNDIFLEFEYIPDITFKADKKVFTSFLLSWMEICNKGFKKIIIYWDGNSLDLEGVN